MAEVTLHIYDVANGSERTNRNVVRINNILYGIGLGGIFHSTVQVYGDDEWSFGICEEGTGVFSYPAGMNTMYNYRKSLVLGKTKFNAFQVNQIVRELSKEWPGNSYDLLSKNCNHFCEEFCARLGVPKLPGWVNRFANAVDAAREGAENTASRFRRAKTNIQSASKVAFRFLFGFTSNASTKPSSCSKPGTRREVEPQQQTGNKCDRAMRPKCWLLRSLSLRSR